MRRRAAAILVPALLAVSALASVPGDTVGKDDRSIDALKAHLVGLEKQSWEAWKSRDGKFFASFLSEDHVEVGFFGPVDKAAVVAGVGSASCVVEHYSVDDFRLTVFDDDMAALTYHADQSTVCNGWQVPHPVWVSSVYAKRHGRWENVLYQQTQDLRKPAPEKAPERRSP